MENQKTVTITLEEALKIASEHCLTLQTEKVPLRKSLGRVLAANVFSDVDMPPYNKSAMDGFACRSEDLGNELKILETIVAGSPPTWAVTKNCCSKIMTGAEVPDGADVVIMVEQVEETNYGKIRFMGSQTATNICPLGQDLKKGSLALSKLTLIKPQHIAILAAVGNFQPEVFKQPTIGIISTGSELVEPDELLSRSKLRNSNGHQLIAQVQEMGIHPNYYGIVKDDKGSLLEVIKTSTDENIITIVSGGVSVGDFDFVPWAIREVGFKILFDKLSVKPGQHTTFAFRDGSNQKYIIGLPGNPVSSFIQFEVFVKPIVNKLQGLETKELVIPVQIAENFERKKADYTEILPIIINSKNQAELVRYNGSAHIHAYESAFGFMLVAKDKKEIKKGEIVYVRPL